MLIDEKKRGKDPSARMRRGREKKKKKIYTSIRFYTLRYSFFFPHPVNGPRFSLPLSYDHDDERDEVIRLSRVNSDLD